MLTNFTRQKQLIFFNIITTLKRQFTKKLSKKIEFLTIFLLKRFQRITKNYNFFANILNKKATNKIFKNLIFINKHIIVYLIRNSLAQDKVANENIKKIINNLYFRLTY